MTGFEFRVVGLRVEGGGGGGGVRAWFSLGLGSGVSLKA